MSRRILSRASAGQRPARVGTVDTTVMSRRMSHGPKSMPERTRDRGAGTRQPPWPQASHISSQEASKATDKPASTRSSGPKGPCGWLTKKRLASASTKAAAERWLTATPLGLPVEPEVKMIHAVSSGRGAFVSSAGASGRAESRRKRNPSSVKTPSISASPKTISARSSGSSASTGT